LTAHQIYTAFDTVISFLPWSYYREKVLLSAYLDLHTLDEEKKNLSSK